MRALLAASMLLVLAGACAKREGRTLDTGARQSADTMVTKRTMQDTAIVQHDTNVSTDTIRKRGTKPVKTDTVQKH
jgi:hypothetical protein